MSCSVSRTVFVHEPAATGPIEVFVPANSCITQIYASAVSRIGAIIDYMEIEIFSPSSFIHRSLASGDGSFATIEITPVNPLYVGPEPILVRAAAIRRGDPYDGTLTVLYSEDCSEEVI